MLRRETNDFRWETVPGFEARLAEVLASPARMVKESPAKVVTLHATTNGDFYVKRYRHASVTLRPLKFLFKSSQARQEWQLARRLEGMDIPIVWHVALGERWSWRGLLESVLITEGFAGKPLDEASGVNPQAVLGFVGKLHESGVLQRDLHPGNILANPATGELRLVDLHGIEIKSSLTAEERAANVAFLAMLIALPVSEEVLRLSARLRQPYLAHRARRCLKHNREFAPQRHGGLRWQVRLPFLNDAAREVLAEPDEYLASKAEILKPGRSSTVGRAAGLVLKRYNLRKLANLAKDLFRPSKARRAFQKAYHLELAGVPTARPIATADRRRARVLLRSYLLMEAISGAVDLGHWTGDPAHALRCAADVVAKLHDEGFSHRDLKETNLVFDRDQRLFLIDLEGLEYVRETVLTRARADLARFARGVMALPRLRDLYHAEFLARYCQRRGLRIEDLASGAPSA